jgi:hypothetical protein
LTDIALFLCPKHAGSLRLSTASCAAMWRKARITKPGEPASVCHGCDIGARHAGESAAAAANTDGLGLICVRCHRTASRFVRGLVCISCYNREREVAIGVNARGKKPVRLAKPWSGALMVKGLHKELRLHRAKSVTSMTELMLSVLRKDGAAVEFSRAPMMPYSTRWREDAQGKK